MNDRLRIFFICGSETRVLLRLGSTPTRTLKQTPSVFPFDNPGPPQGVQLVLVLGGNVDLQPRRVEFNVMRLFAGAAGPGRQLLSM